MCVYCVKCTKFGKLFLRKVIETVATRCLDFSSERPKMRLAAGRGGARVGESPPPTKIPGPHLKILVTALVMDRHTDGRTDGQNCYINIVCHCADAHDKNSPV